VPFAASTILSVLLDFVPWLTAMGVLLCVSAFFSASEAALFYLRWPERRVMRSGTRTERIAERLLSAPERLLSAILFWNLFSNMAYFAITSIIALSLEKSVLGRGSAVAFSIGSLVGIIFCSEMVPKSLAVLNARRVSTFLARPLDLAVRLADPFMPLLETVNLLSRRLIWPGFQSEGLVSLDDLERAIELSTLDAQLIEQEKAALRNIVLLSDIRVDEWMRPRTQYTSFRAPVSLRDLGGKPPPSGYVLIADPRGGEVVASLRMDELIHAPPNNLQKLAQEVVVLPWCATVADALEEMRGRKREVTAIVNEFGETIGILTLDDVLDTVFTYHPSRSKLLLDRKPIHDLGPGRWLVAGVTSLRRLERDLKLELPPSKSITVAGVVQEALQRLAKTGDECDWGPFHLRVFEAPERGHMLIELTLAAADEEPDPS
jgi:putative hemolysin